MTLLTEERSSDSPYVEAVTHGITTGAGSSVRPAETHWHMVFVREHGNFHPLIVGPLATAGEASWGNGGEILWIKFKLGVFMPNLPLRNFLDLETSMPEGAGQSFWLNGSVWQLPNYENVDTFINNLIRDDTLKCDPIVEAALQGEPQDIPSRTVRHRFLRATGLTQSYIYQSERAQRAATLLQQGVPILDTVYEAGYFDQPHLTRSLKRFVGRTPAQLLPVRETFCHSVQDTTPEVEYSGIIER